MFVGLQTKVSVILDGFLIKCEFCQHPSKNMQISKFMKLHPVEAQLFRAEGCTGWHDEADSQFSQFCTRI